MNVPLDRSLSLNLSAFYSVPEQNKHRLVSPLVQGALHYRWLCFSSASLQVPPSHLGLNGDLWVCTHDDCRVVYYRANGSWLVCSPRARASGLVHPFAPDLVLAFGVWKLGWFPPTEVEDAFPQRWSQRTGKGKDEYRNLNVAEMVQALYEPSGMPLNHGSVEPHATCPSAHACKTQVRSYKQWHAPRVQFDFGGGEAGSKSFSAGTIPIAMKDYTELTYSDAWYSDGSLVFITDDMMHKVRPTLFKKYLRSFRGLDGEIVTVLGGYPVHNGLNSHDDIDSDDLKQFLALTEHGIEAAPRSWSTKDLIDLLSISSQKRLDMPKLRHFARRTLAALWSADLEALTPTQLDGADDALMAVHWRRVPQIAKRALYELVRDPDFLHKINTSRHPRVWFLSDRQVFQIFLARERLQHEWRQFVLVAPAFIAAPCPHAPTAVSGLDSDSQELIAQSRSASERCTPARRACTLKWDTTIGERMLGEEYRHDPVCSMDHLIGTDWKSLGLCVRCASGMRRVCEEQKKQWWAKLDVWFVPETGTDEDDLVFPERGGDDPEYDSESDGDEDEDDEGDEDENGDGNGEERGKHRKEDEDEDEKMEDGEVYEVRAPPPLRISSGALGRAVVATISKQESARKVSGLPNKPGKHVLPTGFTGKGRAQSKQGRRR